MVIEQYGSRINFVKITDYRMDPEFKAMWVEALRSDAFTQGKGALSRMGQGINGHRRRDCCLGVLCFITGMEELPSISIDSNSITYRFPGTQIDFSTTILPYELAKALDIRDWRGEYVVNPSIYYFDGERNLIGQSLSTLNDGDFTFLMIADIINYFF